MKAKYFYMDKLTFWINLWGECHHYSLVGLFCCTLYGMEGGERPRSHSLEVRVC